MQNLGSTKDKPKANTNACKHCGKVFNLVYDKYTHEKLCNLGKKQTTNQAAAQG